MSIVNLIYSIIRKYFKDSQDGGNAYFSSLILLSIFSFGTFYNLLISLFVFNFNAILYPSLLFSLLTPIVLHFYPGFNYLENRVSKISKARIELMAIGIFAIAFLIYFGSVYIIYQLKTH